MIRRSGFTLVEVVVASAVFLIIVAAFGGAVIYSQGGMTRAGERGRASFLALEGIEATRAIRDASFAALTDGQHGLAVSGGRWSFWHRRTFHDAVFLERLIHCFGAVSASICRSVRSTCQGWPLAS